MSSQLHENLWGEAAGTIRKHPIMFVVGAFVLGFGVAAWSARSNISAEECILQHIDKADNYLKINTIKESCRARYR